MEVDLEQAACEAEIANQKPEIGVDFVLVPSNLTLRVAIGVDTDGDMVLVWVESKLNLSMRYYHQARPRKTGEVDVLVAENKLITKPNHSPCALIAVDDHIVHIVRFQFTVFVQEKGKSESGQIDQDANWLVIHVQDSCEML